MEADDSELRTSIRYEPDDRPPILLAFGLGLRLAILSVAGIVLTTAIVVRAGGGTEAFLSWAVFASVGISGVSTMIQAMRCAGSRCAGARDLRRCPCPGRPRRWQLAALATPPRNLA